MASNAQKLSAAAKFISDAPPGEMLEVLAGRAVLSTLTKTFELLWKKTPMTNLNRLWRSITLSNLSRSKPLRVIDGYFR